METAAIMRAGRISTALRAVYAICLMGATYNHVVIIATHGLFWTYGGVPVLSRLFWTMLTVVDPTAVLLLFLRPNIGVAMTIFIIVLDVGHNLWIGIRYFPPPFLRHLAHAPEMIEQIGFMIFVLGTAHFAWRRPAGYPI